MWDWYNLFNLDEWIATGLISRKLTLFFDGKGTKDVLITQGNETSITIDDVILPLNFADKNPWQDGTHSVFVDEDMNVWIGFEVSA